MWGVLDIIPQDIPQQAILSREPPASVGIVASVPIHAMAYQNRLPDGSRLAETLAPFRRKVHTVKPNIWCVV